jgi:hypothetical protein
MWALFTAALTRGSSATRVSIINTSANFMLTALLGLVMFGEKLPPLWWVGAAGLVVGNVVVGRREEGDGSGKGKGDMGGSRPREGYRDVDVDVDVDGDSDGVEMDGKVVGGEVDVISDESRAPAKG